MANESKQKSLEEVQYETAMLNLEEARERNERLRGERESRTRKNKERQAQLATDRANRQALAEFCNHRQGGSPSTPYKGRGDSALYVARMPDGFTKVVCCQICRGRWWRPHPGDGARKLKDGETNEQRAERLADFRARTEKYEQMLERAQDKLTVEAAQEMDCGVTFTVTNGEGNSVIRRRPCDSYAV